MKTKLHSLLRPFLLLISFVFVFNDMPINAQITISENAILGNFNKVIREVLYETNTDIDDQLATILTATGEDQIWNFVDLNYVDSTVTLQQRYNIPADDPYISDPNFAAATFIEEERILPFTGGPQDTTLQFLYSSLENGRYVTHGAITITDIDFNGSIDTLMQWFSPEALQAVFPVMYNSEWHDSTTGFTIFPGFPPASSVSLDSNWVVGWGQLTTPAGSAQALRIQEKEIDGPVVFPFDNVSNSVAFVSENDEISASIVIEDGRAFYNRKSELDGTTSTRKVPQLSFKLEQNFPNPFNNQTTISFSTQNSGQVAFNIFDINGHLQKSIPSSFYTAGEHTHSISIEQMPAGQYVLEMRVGGQYQHRLMQVIR